jgi:hypothetical protein
MTQKCHDHRWKSARKTLHTAPSDVRVKERLR